MWQRNTEASCPGTKVEQVQKENTTQSYTTRQNTENTKVSSQKENKQRQIVHLQ